MKRSIFYLFFLLKINFVSAQEARNFPELSNFLVKNYSLPETLKSDCNIHLLGLVMETNSMGIITRLKYLNEASSDLKESFIFLLNAKVDKAENINGRPLLLIVMVDQQNKELCPALYAYDASPAMVARQLVSLFEKQFLNEPRTVIWGTFTPVAPAPPIR